ncbi:cupredoxin domain-containing protein [Meiothermus cerbereus]|uniref:cupredoxin domain-containing protein n=1 Tax=Meiothermus cerbereus TaxID=65552 RepID=UPI003EE9EC3A
MRWLLLLMLGALMSCQPSSSSCVVIEALGIERGFRVVGTDSANVTIRQGGCIEFVNVDPTGTVHLAQTKPNSGAPENFITPNLLPNPAQKERVVLNLAGEYEYICSLNTGNVVHARNMFGKITVR